MSATCATVRSFTVAGFTAEVSLGQVEPGTVHCASVEWTPRVPNFERDFDDAQRAEYQQRLMEAIAGVVS